MTALAVAPSGPRRGYPPTAAGGVDRVIRVSTAVVVLAVAGIAAYISYWHAYAVVREYGETGVTARLEPATIDGLVYASSMVILYAARHQLPVPRLARWLLTLGIVATLAANMAQGWSNGPGGMVVAAWPAASLVGSYELLAWIIRKAAAGGPDRVPVADHCGPQPDQARHWPAVHHCPVASCRAKGPARADARRRGRPTARGPHSRSGPANRTRPGRSGPRGPRHRHQRRRRSRLPHQPPERPAALGAQAREHVRQDLPALGTQPHRRSPAEPGTCLLRVTRHECRTSLLMILDRSYEADRNPSAMVTVTLSCSP